MKNKQKCLFKQKNSHSFYDKRNIFTWKRRFYLKCKHFQKSSFYVHLEPIWRQTNNSGTQLNSNPSFNINWSLFNGISQQIWLNLLAGHNWIVTPVSTNLTKLNSNPSFIIHQPKLDLGGLQNLKGWVYFCFRVNKKHIFFFERKIIWDF